MHAKPINPALFHPVNVTDTCAVWNVLSSRRLYSAAMAAKCQFAITGFVRYECLIKERGAQRPHDTALMDRLRNEQRDGHFPVHETSIADLQHIAGLEDRKRLGLGELSSIAFAMKTNLAVMTDDQNARKLAQGAGHDRVQTTPHLFGWLFYSGALTESDKAKVVEQHEEMGGILRKHFGDAYDMAHQARWGDAQRG